MKRLGVSVDWSRQYFTMDADLSRAVREAFVRLHEQGLIYRGAYIVNWCPDCQTAISDLEVIHEEQLGKLYTIPYGIVGSNESLLVATTRPETMFGDVAVAVHPIDERYRHLQGESVRVPFHRARDSHHRRPMGQPRVRHRSGQDHTRARSQRLRSRPAPQAAVDQRDGRDRAPQRDRWPLRRPRSI